MARDWLSKVEAFEDRITDRFAAAAYPRAEMLSRLLGLARFDSKKLRAIQSLGEWSGRLLVPALTLLLLVWLDSDEQYDGVFRVVFANIWVLALGSICVLAFLYALNLVVLVELKRRRDVAASRLKRVSDHNASIDYVLYLRPFYIDRAVHFDKVNSFFDIFEMLLSFQVRESFEERLAACLEPDVVFIDLGGRRRRDLGPGTLDYDTHEWFAEFRITVTGLR